MGRFALRGKFVAWCLSVPFALSLAVPVLAGSPSIVPPGRQMAQASLWLDTPDIAWGGRRQEPEEDGEASDAAIAEAWEDAGEAGAHAAGTGEAVPEGISEGSVPESADAFAEEPADGTEDTEAYGGESAGYAAGGFGRGRRSEDAGNAMENADAGAGSGGVSPGDAAFSGDSAGISAGGDSAGGGESAGNAAGGFGQGQRSEDAGNAAENADAGTGSGGVSPGGAAFSGDSAGISPEGDSAGVGEAGTEETAPSGGSTAQDGQAGEEEGGEDTDPPGMSSVHALESERASEHAGSALPFTLIFVILAAAAAVILGTVLVLWLIGAGGERERETVRVTGQSGGDAPAPKAFPGQGRAGRTGTLLRFTPLLDAYSLRPMEAYLETQLILGSAPGCDLLLADPDVEARHARIFYRDGQIYVEDLQSRCGTAIGGMRIYAPNPLRDGDDLLLGTSCFRVSI